MSKLFSFRYNFSSLRFGLMLWPQNKTSDTCHERLPTCGVLFESVRLGTVLLVKVGGLREPRMTDGLMTGGLMEVDNRKGSGMMTGYLVVGSTRREHYRRRQTTRYFQRY